MKYLLLICLLFVGCGKSDEQNTAGTKSLFSRWIGDSDGMILDLTGASCGSPITVHFNPLAGGVCNGTFACYGNSASGNMIFAGFTYAPGSATPDVDPGCAGYNSTYTYTNNGTTLRFVYTVNGAVFLFH